MSAIPSSQVMLRESSPGRMRPPRRRYRRAMARAHPYRAQIWEVGSKLGISLVLLVIATTGLVRLVPRAIAQQEQLQDIEQEVLVLDERVNTLQSDFNYRFDPQQAQRIMQEQSNRVTPGQVQVIWLDPSQKQAEVAPAPADHPLP